MGNINKTNIQLYVFCLCFTLSSCKDIEHVFIKNNTNETIIAKVNLLTHDGEQIMETSIAPNESDGWEFELDRGDRKVIDEKLKSIVLTNSLGCKKELLRNEILSLAKKSGAWNIIIDEEVMSCK